MKDQQVMKDWKKCVKKAKSKTGVPKDSFTLIKGATLKEAQKCFCAMGY
jgi:hypothetical protein